MTVGCVKSVMFPLCDAVISETVDSMTNITIVFYCFCLLPDAEHGILAIAKFLVFAADGQQDSSVCGTVDRDIVCC